MKVTEQSWADDTPEKLRGACGGDNETIKAEVQGGLAKLFHLEAVDVDLWAVLRFERYIEGDEMVVVCVGGHGMENVGSFLIDEANRQGLKAIRYHCQSKSGMQRLYERYGFAGEEVERVYKVKLGGAHGQ